MDDRRVTSVRTTISELCDFGLSYGITQVLGNVADGRPGREEWGGRQQLTGSDPGPNGNFGLADIARGGTVFHLRYWATGLLR